MRIEANEANRLVKLDPARLLEGYRKRPGRQSWDGEHVGKWLHAATLAWVYTPATRPCGRSWTTWPPNCASANSRTVTWALTWRRTGGPTGMCGRTSTT